MPDPAETPTPTASEPPAYMADWPEDLRSDPDLTRYQSPQDLAKGLKETRAWARGRVPLPQDEAGFRELGEKLRPESPEGYAFELPEGDNGEMAKAFGQFAFDTGIPKPWAENTAKWFNRQQAEAIGKIKSANDAEIKALDLEYGTLGYNTRLDAVDNMLRAAGLEDFTVVEGLQTALGADGKPAAGATLKALFTLAEKYGELEKVDTTGTALRMGNVTPEQADAETNRMFADPAIRAKLQDKNSAEYKRYEQLKAIRARGAAQSG